MPQFVERELTSEQMFAIMEVKKREEASVWTAGREYIFVLI